MNYQHVRLIAGSFCVRRIRLGGMIAAFVVCSAMGAVAQQNKVHPEWFANPKTGGYKKAVATELGVMRGVWVPAELTDAYEYLISPLHNSVVSSGGCGWGGTTPQGKKAIDALLQANRVDLVENVLKGLNPGGRVYAAIALLGLKNRGLPLSDEAKIAIRKVSELGIIIKTCRGCIITDRTAREILEVSGILLRNDQLVQ